MVIFGLFCHFIKDKLGPNFHKIEAVRLPPPSTFPYLDEKDKFNQKNLCRYLTLEEQYKFLKNLAKDSNSIKLKVVLMIIVLMVTMMKKKMMMIMMIIKVQLGGGQHKDQGEEFQQRHLQHQHR